MNSVRSSRSAKPSEFEHDGDDVGLVGLVELDEAVGERDRASASRARSRARRMRSWRSSSWMRASSARLASRSAWMRTCLRCSTVMSHCSAPILRL